MVGEGNLNVLVRSILEEVHTKVYLDFPEPARASELGGELGVGTSVTLPV